MEVPPPHEPCDCSRDLDAGCAQIPAAEGQGDVDVPLPIDEYAEEGKGKGVSSELAVGPRDIGDPDVGPLALLDEAMKRTPSSTVDQDPPPRCRDAMLRWC